MVGYFGSESIDKEANAFGMSPFAIDEQVFAQGKVRCVGQIIGVVAAEDQEVARLAATKVKVEYEKLPSILSIEDAINDYFTKTWLCLKCLICFNSVRAMKDRFKSDPQDP